MALNEWAVLQAAGSAIMRWDIISAVLTLTSMLAIGQRKWQGWGLAFLNSVTVCILALHVAPKQWALIPTNLFCLGIYARNLVKWQREDRRRKVNKSAHPKISPRVLLRVQKTRFRDVEVTSGRRIEVSRRLKDVIRDAFTPLIGSRHTCQ
jgi:hypothetical protein